MSRKIARAVASACCFLAALAQGVHGEPATDEPPLFVAFKTFCVATQSIPGAVKAAVEAAGGVAISGPAQTDWPFHMTTQGWAYTLRGHRMTINAGTIHARTSATGPMKDSIVCSLNGSKDDGAGLAAIAKWVGVPSSGGIGDDITYYTYVERDGARVPVAPRTIREWRQLDSSGYWTLTLISIGGSAALQLIYSQTSIDPR